MRFHRPSPAMVVALIALIAATAGTGIAARKLVSGDKLIKKHSLSGDRLRNGTLSAKQIDLAALGTVPRAASATSATTATNALHATNADHATAADSATTAGAVGGLTPVQFALKGPANSGPQTMVDLQGLRLTLSCNASANPVVAATNTSAQPAELEFVRVSNASAVVESGSAAFQPTNTVDVLGGVTTGHVSFSFYRIDGRSVTGQFAFDNNPAFGSFAGCATGGTAIGG